MKKAFPIINIVMNIGQILFHERQKYMLTTGRFDALMRESQKTFWKDISQIHISDRSNQRYSREHH